MKHPSGWQDAYDEELRALLQAKIGAEDVIVFDHTVRVDDPNAERRPARNVHNDYSRTGAEQRLIDLVGDERAAQLSRRPLWLRQCLASGRTHHQDLAARLYPTELGQA